MKITDMLSISELSRLLKKSRPTVYKYVFDYENGSFSGIPSMVKKLFDEIRLEKISKREVYAYCERWFLDGAAERKDKENKESAVTLKDVIKLLKTNQDKLNFFKVKEYIEKEIGK